MLNVLFFIVVIFLKSGASIEGDNLRSALNSIENRQRQLASNYYVLPNKDVKQAVQFNDDNLMYLDSTPPDFDYPHRGQIPYPSKSSSSKNYRLYEYDRPFVDDADEYQKSLNERLIEQLWLDVVKNDDEFQTHQRPQKKSFFREREINEDSENLQSLYPNADSDGKELPSSFRERIKPKLHSNPHRRVAQPYGTGDTDNDDYFNSLSALGRKYDGISSQDFDPETMTIDDAEQFLKYLGDKEFDKNVDFNRELYLIEGKERDRSKRYWLGSSDSHSAKNSIQKRSAGFEQKPVTKTANVAKTNSMPGKMTVSNAEGNNTEATTTKPQKVTVDASKTLNSKRGQKEVPVNLKSLKPLNIKKKSVDWTNYFGVDKRQKKSNSPPKEQHKNDVLLDQYIQSHILQSVRNSAFNNYGNNYRYFPKRDLFRGAYADDVDRRLETADDLKTAVDIIIDHVLKYTGAHEGIKSPEDLRRFRKKVINELTAAYNLEKIRNDIFDDPRLSLTDRTKKQHQHSNNKRVAVKKENAEILPSEMENLKNKHNGTFFGQNSIKRSSYDYDKQINNINEIVNDECPVLYEIVEKCLQISAKVKDRDSVFTPFCALHHICTICGSADEMLSCDLTFYSDVNAICSDEPVCRYTAQRMLYAMKSVDLKSYVSINTCDSCIAEILQFSFEK